MVRLRLLAEKEKGVPDAQPLKSLVMGSRSHVVHFQAAGLKPSPLGEQLQQGFEI
jgi:hypothetical protein